MHDIVALKCDKTAAALLGLHSGIVYSFVFVRLVLGNACVSLKDLDLRKLLRKGDELLEPIMQTPILPKTR